MKRFFFDVGEGDAKERIKGEGFLLICEHTAAAHKIGCEFNL